MQNENRFRSFALNIGLIISSSSIALVICNFAFLHIIRSGKQLSGFPRSILSDLPAPSRWNYPDVGTSQSSKDIALIGDSYVEGSSDDYTNNAYKYSFAHFLHDYTGEPIANFGTSGSHLNKQLELYSNAMKGNFSPLIDGRKKNDQPTRIIFFFYEGNDLDDYFNEKNEGGNATQISALKSYRKYFPLRLYLKSKLINTKLPFISDTTRNEFRSSSETTTNSFCGDDYCRKNYRMQSASPNLSKNEIDESVDMTAKSIIDFMKTQDKARACVVYIPSPGTTYNVKDQIKFEQAKYGDENRDGNVTVKSNMERSLRIRKRLDAAFTAANIPFLDSTPSVRKAANQYYLHGQGDQKHFNERGNKAMALFVAKNLTRCFPG